MPVRVGRRFQCSRFDVVGARGVEDGLEFTLPVLDAQAPCDPHEVGVDIARRHGVDGLPDQGSGLALFQNALPDRLADLEREPFEQFAASAVAVRVRLGGGRHACRGGHRRWL